jgi:2,4-dienoyl-CoA reductase-like NADH-dependent reductase (Old Yellow Enzyme family)
MYFAYSYLCVTMVKEAFGDKLAVASVSMINNGETAEKILSQDNVDVILGVRAFQRNTGMAWHFAKNLDVEIPAQIRWGFTSFRNASAYIQAKLYEGLLL